MGAPGGLTRAARGVMRELAAAPAARTAYPMRSAVGPHRNGPPRGPGQPSRRWLSSLSLGAGSSVSTRGGRTGPERPPSISRYTQRLRTIKEVRDLAAFSDGLTIPQLVVVGSQSVGKSTVMTACTDVPFPQGDGICTKAATVVSCSHDPALQENRYEVRDVTSGQQAYKEVNRDDVADEILKQQAFLLAQEGKTVDATWIVKEEIRLRVSGPDTMDIVLVDLPGLIENAPEDVAEEELERLKTQIEHLVCKYIERPETLIAVVQRADEDIERVKAIRMARRFDDQGVRTFKILNMFDIFTNSVTKERAVRLVNDGRDSDYGAHALTRKCKESEGVKSEEEEHEELLKLGVADGRAGIRSLRPRLEKMFEKLIDANLPALTATVRRGLEQTEQLLNLCGRETLPPTIMIQRAVRTLEEAKSDLTKRMTVKQLMPFKDAVHNTRSQITLDFVSEGYCHDASKPGELQLEEPFRASVVKVADLWKPHLETYLSGVCAICEDWVKSHLSTPAVVSCQLRTALLARFQQVFERMSRDFKRACLAALDDELRYKTVNDHYFNTKKRQCDVFPRALEEEFKRRLEEEVGERIKKMRTTIEALPHANDWKRIEQATDELEKGFVDKLMECLLESRDNIKTERMDMVENNKHEIHALVMANFDVAKKVFCDNVWSSTISLVGPVQRKYGSVSATPDSSIMDWVKFGIMTEDKKLLDSAYEDREQVQKREELVKRMERLEGCNKLLSQLSETSEIRGPHGSQLSETSEIGGPHGAGDTSPATVASAGSTVATAGSDV